MRELIFIPAVLAALAALGRAASRVGFLGILAGLLTLTAFACGGYLDGPSPLRGACWLYGIALLGKTLALGRGPRSAIGFGRGLAFLLLWPGLDPSRAFVVDPAAHRRAGLASAVLGAAEVFAGLVFITYASKRGWLGYGDFVPAWCRLLSFASFLDGGFRGMEGFLQFVRFRPEHVFRSPWKARDLADFWGNRWNRFVGKTLALEVYAPVKRRFGRVAAMIATFFHSGFLHEALFRGSTEGPTGRYMVFFLLQGVAVAETVEYRAKPGGGGVLRRAVAWGILLATAPLFFGGCYPTVVPLERVLAGLF